MAELYLGVIFAERCNDMWYVMQVISGQENRTVLLVERLVPEGILEKCVVPIRRLRKKYHGSWHEVTEKIFPGYIFIITRQPQLLYEEMKGIPALTRILGRCGEYFTPLPDEDIRFLYKLQKIWKEIDNGKKCVEKDTARISEVGLSKVIVKEDRQIQIISGPLKNLEGQIKKINLHKRIAVVETEFMGNRPVIHLGIEIVEDSKLWL